MSSQDHPAEPIYALRAINVRGREYLPGDEVPPPPSLIERGLATADPDEAARLREITQVQGELRAMRHRVCELEERLAELRSCRSRRTGMDHY